MSPGRLVAHEVNAGVARITLDSPHNRAPPGWVRVDCHLHTAAAYLEMPDFDGPAGFLAALAAARVTGEFRPHVPRYPRRPPAGR